jgi:hypothetical protein
VLRGTRIGSNRGTRVIKCRASNSETLHPRISDMTIFLQACESRARVYEDQLDHPPKAIAMCYRALEYIDPNICTRRWFKVESKWLRHCQPGWPRFKNFLDTRQGEFAAAERSFIARIARLYKKKGTGDEALNRNESEKSLVTNPHQH